MKLKLEYYQIHDPHTCVLYIPIYSLNRITHLLFKMILHTLFFYSSSKFHHSYILSVKSNLKIPLRHSEFYCQSNKRLFEM